MCLTINLMLNWMYINSGMAINEGRIIKEWIKMICKIEVHKENIDNESSMSESNIQNEKCERCHRNFWSSSESY